MIQSPLWPTRRATLPPGDTAVIGHFVSQGGVTPVDGLRVVLFIPPGPAPVRPYTRTDAAGDFVFRMPQLRRVAGNPAVILHDFEVRDAANAIVPVLQPPAASIAVEIGRVVAVGFTIP